MMVIVKLIILLLVIIVGASYIDIDNWKTYVEETAIYHSAKNKKTPENL